MKYKKNIIILLRQLLLMIFICFFKISYCQVVDNYTETNAKQYLTSTTTLAPIEGIWLSDNGFRLSIEKNPENLPTGQAGGQAGGTRNAKRFRVVILSINYTSDFWKPGSIRAFIECTASPDIFYIDYFIGNHDTLKTETCTGHLEDEQLLKIKFSNNKTIDEITLYKVFPKQEDNSFTEKDIYSPAYGSGLFFTEDGYIITNLHVVCDAEDITVTGVNKDFKKKYKAKVIIADEVNDLALLKISDTEFKNLLPIPFAFRFGNVTQGEDVYALGFPDATEMPEIATLSDGKITSTSGVNGNNSFYRTSLRLRPGNSGGPLFDKNGNIIGINYMRINETENVGYAVNAKCIRALINISEDKPLLPFLNTVEEKPLLEKVRILSNYVCIVDCNNYFKFSSFDVEHVKVLGAKNTLDASDKAESYYSMALYNINRKDYGTALYNLNEAIGKGLRNTTIFYLRGQVRIILQQELNDAIEDFNYCLKNDTNTTYVGMYNYYRGATYDLLKKYNEAKSDYTTCINNNGEMVGESVVARALVNAELGEYDSAIADWDILLAKMNNNESTSKATIYFYKADCLLKINKPEDALTLINQALDIVTTDVRLWILRARIYFKLMQYDNTVRDINKSLSVDEVPEAYYVRSMAYKELGEKEKACKDFNRAVSSGYKETQSDMINYCENEK